MAPLSSNRGVLPFFTLSTIALVANATAFELALYRSGGLLAAGVDPTGVGGTLPGFGDRLNLELLREAGFAPEEAVQR